MNQSSWPHEREKKKVQVSIEEGEPLDEVA